MATEPFDIRPELTAIAIGYRNPAHALIADKAIRFTRDPVKTKSFAYTEFPIAEGLTVPDTKVGRLGVPGEVVQSGARKSETCEDFGLSESVPKDDIDQGRTQKIDPLSRAVENLQNLILLDKERRVAEIVQDTGRYADGHVVALSGTDMFSDYNKSDPVRLLTEIMDGMLIRPNTMILGQTVWSKIKLHPKVLKSIHPNGNGEGVATKAQVADLLELKTIAVGESWINVAAKGQGHAPTARLGQYPAIAVSGRDGQQQPRPDLGASARYGQKVAGTMPMPALGLRGGVSVKVGETVKEFVVSKECGYLLTNVV